MKIYLKGAQVVLDSGAGKKYIPSAHTRFEIMGDNVLIHDTLLNDNTSSLFDEIEDEAGVPIGTVDQVADYLAEFVGSFSFGGVESALSGLQQSGQLVYNGVSALSVIPIPHGLNGVPRSVLVNFKTYDVNLAQAQITVDATKIIITASIPILANNVIYWQAIL